MNKRKVLLLIGMATGSTIVFTLLLFYLLSLEMNVYLFALSTAFSGLGIILMFIKIMGIIAERWLKEERNDN